MKTFGIRTHGLEQAFENLFVNYLKELKDNNFYYLEIGAAGCVSMKSFYEIIKENIKSDITWAAIGLDLPNGWSLDWKTINQFAYPLDIIQNGAAAKENKDSNAILILEDDPRKWISNLKNNSIDICFIDGCHGSKCVMADFLAIESKIKDNGIVFFHDACIFSQNTDWQGHCGENINARKAIIDLGLFDNKRSGWKFMAEVNGSRAYGGDGNGIVIVSKTV